MDQQLQAWLKEKEVLSQEVHHRIKNNDEVMISMISTFSVKRLRIIKFVTSLINL